mgnify:CR=1 FL=1
MTQNITIDSGKIFFPYKKVQNMKFLKNNIKNLKNIDTKRTTNFVSGRFNLNFCVCRLKKSGCTFEKIGFENVKNFKFRFFIKGSHPDGELQITNIWSRIKL